MQMIAERAFITRKTLGRVERGDQSVSMGIYASVLFVLGMVERIADLADARADTLGMSLEEEQLPRRVRPRRT